MPTQWSHRSHCVCLWLHPLIKHIHPGRVLAFLTLSDTCGNFKVSRSLENHTNSYRIRSQTESICGWPNYCRSRSHRDLGYSIEPICGFFLSKEIFSFCQPFERFWYSHFKIKWSLDCTTRSIEVLNLTSRHITEISTSFMTLRIPSPSSRFRHYKKYSPQLFGRW